MAQYKSGNTIKSQEEHDDEVLSLYASILFLVGAGSVIYGLNQIVPEEWAKEWRFLIIFPSAVGVGALLSMLKYQAYTASLYLFGIDCIFSILTLYSFIHFGKPLVETIGSIFGGYILGVIALKKEHIFGGCIIHIGVAYLMELSALWQHYYR